MNIKGFDDDLFVIPNVIIDGVTVYSFWKEFAKDFHDLVFFLRELTGLACLICDPES